MFENRALIFALLIFISFDLLEAKRMIPRQTLISETIDNCPERCAYAFRCSPYYSKELIWALDAGICKVFANSCVYGSVVCQRQNDCLPAMIDSNKVECQQRCASDCDSKPESTVCAWFPMISVFGTPDEEYKEFKNQCALDQWSCSNERPYGQVNQGPCS